MTNLLAQIPASLPDEITETLVQSKNVRIERIVSCGQASPEGFWFDQDQNEWVAVIQGAARLQFEDEVVEMNSGNWVNIAAHRRHRVEWTTPHEPTTWLAVFFECDARLTSPLDPCPLG
jgi:cupin 2 domain-containing protein